MPEFVVFLIAFVYLLIGGFISFASWLETQFAGRVTIWNFVIPLIWPVLLPFAFGVPGLIATFTVIAGLVAYAVAYLL